MINSMTAFSRQQTSLEWAQLTLEIRSVNHRYLDVSFKLPESVRHCEPELRELLRSKIGRGKVDCNLHLHMAGNSCQPLAIDQGQLAILLAATREIEQRLGNSAPMSALEILQWPGILPPPAVDHSPLAPAIHQLFTQGIDNLNAARQREGAALAAEISSRLEKARVLVDRVSGEIPKILASQQERIRGRLEQLQVELDQGRLEQELVHIAQKIDISEELDRLTTHIAETGRVIHKGGACGRRLDFLMQELNREANTISSKSISSSSSQAAVDLKVLIEQMREQVQNIE